MKTLIELIHIKIINVKKCYASYNKMNLCEQLSTHDSHSVGREYLRGRQDGEIRDIHQEVNNCHSWQGNEDGEGQVPAKREQVKI